MQTISLVYMSTLNGLIAVNGKQPYYIKEDLENFSRITRNSLVVMGRNTYEDIIKVLGKPLSNRVSVVLTDNLNYQPEKANVDPTARVFVMHSKLGVLQLNQALGLPIYVIGGKQVYEQFEDLATNIYHTKVHSYYDFKDLDFNIVDMKFYNPIWDKFELVETSEVKEFTDEDNNTHTYEFMTWQRKAF